MRTIETDVVIVGSGFGAAAPALRLSEAGFKVVMIEKGPRIEAPGDFRQTQDPEYLLRYLKQLSGERISLTYAEGRWAAARAFMRWSRCGRLHSHSNSAMHKGSGCGPPRSTAALSILTTRSLRGCSTWSKYR